MYDIQFQINYDNYNIIYRLDICSHIHIDIGSIISIEYSESVQCDIHVRGLVVTTTAAEAASLQVYAYRCVTYI